MHRQDIIYPWMCHKYTANIRCAYLILEGYCVLPSFAYHWLYWGIVNESSSLKFHSRLHLCNRKSIYIFIKWWLKMVQHPLNLGHRHSKAKVSKLPEWKLHFIKVKNLSKHSPLLQKYQPLSLAIVHMLEWIRWSVTGKKCAPLVCFVLEQWWRKWLNNTWYGVLISR